MKEAAKSYSPLIPHRLALLKSGGSASKIWQPSMSANLSANQSPKVAVQANATLCCCITLSQSKELT